MADDLLLSELCSVCHIQTPRYRCPRCATKTCSAACVKLHKARAPCTGVRDPTGYKKRSQLGTASGIDHDYNFLRGMERGIDRAERQIEEKGLNQEARQLKHFGALRARIRDIGVRIEKAPVGMQRERMNKTHWAPKARHILWTVEWIDEQDSKHLDEFSEHVTLGQAHTWLLRRLSGKRKSEVDGSNQRGGRRGKKTKSIEAIKTEELDAPKIDDAATDPDNTEETKYSQLGDPSIENVPTAEKQGVVGGSGENKVKTEDKAAESVGVAESNTVEPADTTINGEDMPAADAIRSVGDVKTASAQDAAADKTAVPATPYFYLVKPRTGGSTDHRVLVPISDQATLATCLRGQTILEFPTIQILAHPPGSLPAAFITEEQYKIARSTEDAMLRKEITEAGLNDVSPLPNRVETSEPQISRSKRVPNESDLISILQRDIRG